jgi:DNA-binding MurR/RpiR family transcriptional regulator
MQNSLTVIENEIAQYVMKNAEDVVTNTITTIARNTNTSEASINRFCKKLGFKGFNSFKVALAQESYYNSIKERDELEDATFTSSVSRDYRQMIVNTSAMIDEDSVIEAAAAIKAAARIYVFSVASTALSSAELEFKLSMVGLNAKGVSDANTMRMLALGVQSRDLVAVIVPNIVARDIYQAVSMCKEHGAKILIITSHDSPKLGDLADYKFVTSDKIVTRNALSLSGNLVSLYVIDVIYSALLAGDRNLRQRKLNSDAVIDSNQLINNYMLDF